MDALLLAATLELMGEKQNAHRADKYGMAGVPSVGYSPDGAKVASSGRDGTIKVWDAGIDTDTTPIKHKT